MSDSEGWIVPAIMCGGSGTRLWPSSRESLPKQFIPLIGDRSTFQTAALRVTRPGVFERPVIVAGNDVRFIVAEQLAEVGVAADIVLEPARRDSAAAVAVAALQAAKRRPDAVVLVIAADHVIADAQAFAGACAEALPAARAGFIMTLGVTPHYPATGYGYIQPGEPIEGTQARRVARFVEKPDAATAATYLSDGYLWNSGNFLFRADAMIEELEAFAPAIVKAARSALERSLADLDFVRLDAEAFGEAPKTSIDYAVMERTRRAGVLPVSFSWSDVGTWDGLWDLSPRDAAGNATRGNVELVDTRNALVRSDGALTAVVGMENVVVVTTPDAVLVSSLQESGRVKDLVAVLSAKGHRQASEHLRMYRPWGWYQQVDVGPRFQVKRIMVKPGGRLSLQRHFHRAEHWVVVHGTAEVTVDDKVQVFYENEAVYLPIGCLHRLVNPGRIPLELIEVQVGSYLGEDDIVRVEDVYGRE
jgi:mannose-1-phosphate guanylyltransferase / mannose-6-phosphate isomerase